MSDIPKSIIELKSMDEKELIRFSYDVLYLEKKYGSKKTEFINGLLKQYSNDIQTNNIYLITKALNVLLQNTSDILLDEFKRAYNG